MAKPARIEPKKQHREEYTAFDRALISASQGLQTVHFQMANDEMISGKVCSVDKFNIEVETEAPTAASPKQTTKLWLSKAMIVRTRIEK